MGWQWLRGGETIFEHGRFPNRFPGWIPGSARVSVEECLSRTLNSKLLPVSRLVPCMVSSTTGV